jgi:hypothetical protein
VLDIETDAPDGHAVLVVIAARFADHVWSIEGIVWLSRVMNGSDLYRSSRSLRLRPGRFTGHRLGQQQVCILERRIRSGHRLGKRRSLADRCRVTDAAIFKLMATTLAGRLCDGFSRNCGVALSVGLLGPLALRVPWAGCGCSRQPSFYCCGLVCLSFHTNLHTQCSHRLWPG